MIRLDKIAIVKRGEIILEDIDLTISEGENILLQGKNGSGKTALLETIAGKIVPSSGSVSYSFIDPTADWEERHKLRSQNMHYIPARALHDILGFQRDLYYQQRYYSLSEESAVTVRNFLGRASDRPSELRLPKAFDLSPLLDVPLTRLSNGQIKKAIIVRQLLANIPRLILFDYPFEGLDRPSREELLSFMDYLHNEFGIQFILTDHHHHLPRCINRKLTLDQKRLTLTSGEGVTPNPRTRKIEKKPTLQSSNPVVEFRNIAIRYENATIIENFSWIVKRGERWALTGRNGSGKTTIFSLIFADHPFAYSQPVFLFGRRRGSGESIWDIKKRIGYLGPEQIHFIHDNDMNLTGYDYLKSSVSSSTDIESISSYFQAEYILRKSLHALSSGEIQLIHLMKLFLSERELLLLDEPFQFLDHDQKQRVSNYISSHLHPDTTLILITHYEADMEAWTDKRMHLPDNSSHAIPASHNK